MVHYHLPVDCRTSQERGNFQLELTLSMNKLPGFSEHHSIYCPFSSNFQANMLQPDCPEAPNVATGKATRLKQSD